MKRVKGLLIAHLVLCVVVISLLDTRIALCTEADTQKLAANSSITGANVLLSNAFAEAQQVLKQLGVDSVEDRSEFYKRLSETDVGGVKCFDSTDPKNAGERVYYVVDLEKRYFSRAATGISVNDLFYQLISRYWPCVSTDVREFKIGNKIFYQWLYSISDKEIEFIKSCIAITMSGEGQNKLQPFPTAGVEEFDYSEIADNFNDEYELVLDLSKGRGNRFTPRENDETGAVDLANLLNTAVDSLETVLGASNELKKYWDSLVDREDNKAQLIRIRVNSKILNNSVRYYDPVTNSVEIIFNELFITTLINNKEEYPAIEYVLAERIFHELGHSPVSSFYQGLRQEYEILKRDIGLHRLLSGGIQSGIENFFNNVKPVFPSGRYFRLIQALIKDPDIIRDFDLLLGEVEILEGEQDLAYRNTNFGTYSVNLSTRQQRNERIERAFQVGDPDFGGSISNRIANREKGYKEKGKDKKGIIEGTFLEALFEILTHRAIACGRESFLFLANNPLTVIPFDQFKSPRVPGWIVSPDKEAGRWARQYYAIHKGRRFSDGIGITEAENGRGMQQRWHKHDTTQEFTISLCEDTQLRYGHELSNSSVVRLTIEITDKDTNQKQEIEDEVVYSAGSLTVKFKEWRRKGNLKVKNIESVNLSNVQDTNKLLEHAVIEGKDTIIVVDKEETVPFGHIICMPKNTFHTLRNKSKTRPSIDFTVKDPVTQLIKTFSPPQEKLLESVEVRGIDRKQIQGGEQYAMAYPARYCSKMLTDPETGEMYYHFDERGQPIPVMYAPVGVNLQLVTVNANEETEKFPFVPFYDDMQVIRIFPWPKVIPEDDRPGQIRHAWVLDRDCYKIKAEVTVYDAQGNIIQKEIVQGGDIVILHKSLGAGIKYSVRNISDDNYELVFFMLEPGWDTSVTFESILELRQDKREDVRNAGRKLLEDFIRSQDISTISILLQSVLDGDYSANKLNEIVRVVSPLLENWKDSGSKIPHNGNKETEEESGLAMRICMDLLEASTLRVDKDKLGSLSPKLIRKIKMIANSNVRWELDFADALIRENKYIMLDREELAKPGNRHIKDWVDKITAGKEKSPFVYSMPEGVKREDVIDIREPDKVNDHLPQDRLYLPLPYSISSIYLAQQVVLAGGKVNRIQDKLASSTIKTVYNALLSRELTEDELDELFRRPWTVLPPITQISAALDLLRKVIAQIEVAA